MNKLTVTPAQAGQRLDRFLAESLPAYSRSRLQTLIRDGFVKLNGKQARPRDLAPLPVFGYPVTEQFRQDGLLVQYCERARFELHQGSAPGEGPA